MRLLHVLPLFILALLLIDDAFVAAKKRKRGWQDPAPSLQPWSVQQQQPLMPQLHQQQFYPQQQQNYPPQQFYPPQPRKARQQRMDVQPYRPPPVMENGLVDPADEDDTYANQPYEPMEYHPREAAIRQTRRRRSKRIGNAIKKAFKKGFKVVIKGVNKGFKGLSKAEKTVNKFVRKKVIRFIGKAIKKTQWAMSKALRPILGAKLVRVFNKVVGGVLVLGKKIGRFVVDHLAEITTIAVGFVVSSLITAGLTVLTFNPVLAGSVAGAVSGFVGSVSGAIVGGALQGNLVPTSLNDAAKKTANVLINAGKAAAMGAVVGAVTGGIGASVGSVAGGGMRMGAKAGSKGLMKAGSKAASRGGSRAVSRGAGRTATKNQWGKMARKTALKEAKGQLKDTGMDLADKVLEDGARKHQINAMTAVAASHLDEEGSMPSEAPPTDQDEDPVALAA